MTTQKLYKVFNHDLIDFQPLQSFTSSDGKRVYETPTGERYPSVTTALKHLSKKAIAQWRQRVGNAEAQRVSTAATNRGVSLHKMAEYYLLNERDRLVEDRFLNTRKMFFQIKDLIHRIDNIRGIECPMYSHVHRLAGTADLVAEFDGKLSIIDFKTSEKFKKEEWVLGYFLQMYAYTQMYEEMTGEKIEQVVIIMASGTGTPQLFVKEAKNYKKQFEDAIDFFYKNKYTLYDI